MADIVACTSSFVAFGLRLWRNILAVLSFKPWLFKHVEHKQLLGQKTPWLRWMGQWSCTHRDCVARSSGVAFLDTFQGPSPKPYQILHARTLASCTWRTRRERSLSCALIRSIVAFSFGGKQNVTHGCHNSISALWSSLPCCWRRLTLSWCFAHNFSKAWNRRLSSGSQACAINPAIEMKPLSWTSLPYSTTTWRRTNNYKVARYAHVSA